MLKITCPNNKSHKKFITNAHVVQEWLVNKKGEFDKVINDCVEVTHSPNRDNSFQCNICKVEAKITFIDRY